MDLYGSIFTGMEGGSGMERLSCIMHGLREREEQRIEKNSTSSSGTPDKRMTKECFYI